MSGRPGSSWTAYPLTAGPYASDPEDLAELWVAKHTEYGVGGSSRHLSDGDGAPRAWSSPASRCLPWARAEVGGATAAEAAGCPCGCCAATDHSRGA